MPHHSTHNSILQILTCTSWEVASLLDFADLSNFPSSLYLIFLDGLFRYSKNCPLIGFIHACFTATLELVQFSSTYGINWKVSISWYLGPEREDFLPLSLM